MSSEVSEPTINWHDHYSWDPKGVAGRERIERVLFGCYVNGSTPGSGPLVVYPRRFDEPAVRPHVNDFGDWPGQVVVEAPPGSAVIFDTALWHTARRGSEPGFRYLWGAHVQGWHSPKPHPEDNEVNGPKVQPYLERSPALRKFIAGA